MAFLARHILTAIALLGLSHCVENVCDLRSLDDARFVMRELPIAASHPLVAAAVLPDGKTITVSRPAEELRHLEMSGAQMLPIVVQTQNVLGEGLSTDEEGWWYTTESREKESSGTLFVHAERGGAIETTFVAHPQRMLTVSLPLAGAEPRTLLLSNLTLTAYEISEMTPSGTRRTWRSPAAAARLGYGLESAEPLPGNRAAIVSIEKHDSRGPAAVVLRVLAEEEDVAPITVGTLPTASDLTTAVQPDGTMAIALATRRGITSVVQAAVIDPSTAATNAPLKWIEMSPPGAISPKVVATSEGFVVAWLEEGRPFRLRAREIRNGRAGLYAITVGETGSDAFFTVQVGRDELTFLWMNTSGQAVARTYPAPITGVDLVQRMLERLRCDES